MTVVRCVDCRHPYQITELVPDLCRTVGCGSRMFRAVDPDGPELPDPIPPWFLTDEDRRTLRVNRITSVDLEFPESAPDGY